MTDGSRMYVYELLNGPQNVSRTKTANNHKSQKARHMPEPALHAAIFQLSSMIETERVF